MGVPILVTGGTGTLGRLVVDRLRSAGHDVRVLSRRMPEGLNDSNRTRTTVEYVSADLTTGDGVESAVAGSETILHLAGSSKGDEVKTRHLVEAATRADARHLIYISVVGADRTPVVSAIDRAMFGYYASKHESERVVADSGLPWTTLRATQFHDLALIMAQGMANMPVVPVPTGLRMQPIDADEVAAWLVELSFDEPAGLVGEIGGPQVFGVDEIVRSYLRASGKRRPIVSVRLPGQAARALRNGANLTLDRAVGHKTWDEFLAERTGVLPDPAAVTV